MEFKADKFSGPDSTLKDRLKEVALGTWMHLWLFYNIIYILDHFY